MKNKYESATSKFDEAEGVFDSQQDREILKESRKAYERAIDLEAFSNSPGGREIIKGLKGDITIALTKLLETREQRYISDLSSAFILLTKLTGAKSQTDSILSWLDSVI